jgi:hypothetical protein
MHRWRLGGPDALVSREDFVFAADGGVREPAREGSAMRLEGLCTRFAFLLL